jgi:hypothetical protein
VAQHQAIRDQCPVIRSCVSCVGAGGVMKTVRILNIIYLAQAGIGIIFGIAYAVWRMYLA